MKIYQPQIHQLSNGIRVVYLNIPGQVAHLGYFFNAGSRYEPQDKIGLAHFLEHAVFKGTVKRKAIHVLSRIDAVGGELNAYTAKEEMCLHASFTKDHTLRAIELLSDIVKNATFPEKELLKEKEVVLDEINSYLDNPSEKIFDDFEALFFQNNPLGNNILGTPESVQSITSDDLKSYINSHFTAENLVISFVGNIPYSRIENWLENHIGDLRKGEKPSIIVPFSDYQPFHTIRTEANYQAHVLMGGPAPSYHNDDRVAMSLLMNILGGPALNSRLNISVREKYGLAYNVEASYTSYADTGFWQIYLGCEPSNINKAMRLIQKELHMMQDRPMTEVHLKRAKQQLKGQMALGMDSHSGWMQGLGKSLLAFNQIDTIEEIHREIDLISADKIHELTNKYLADSLQSTLVFDCE
ncbi:MAG: hypothetical protein RL264_416 [Bacteroidota bacterium]|jgi:predicted Zn-dependent peptidase